MFQVHLKAIEARLEAKASEVRKVDHWNQQTDGDGSLAMPPSVFIDFGMVRWQKFNDIKKGTATITVHCISKQFKDTHKDASDKGTGRLKKFEWSEKVFKALDGFIAKDADGNVLITRMEIAATELDTNHDALNDDVHQFTCTLQYYNRYKEGSEVELDGVETEYQNPLPDEV